MQPVRGDWRSRVKAARKNVQKAAEKQKAAETQKAPAKQAPREEQAPDLSEQNKGLPPGWQAIWDAKSKGVYYGNIDTKVAFIPVRDSWVALDC